MIPAVIGIVVIVIGFALLYARRAGGDAAKRKALERAIDQIIETNRPASADELDVVRARHRRD